MIETVEPFVASGAARGDAVASLLGYVSTAYQALGQHDKAIDALKRAKAATPDDVQLDLYLAQAYMTARRYQEAADLAGAAQASVPEDLRFTALKARAQFLAGSRPAALALLERELAAKPDRLEVYLSLAELYQQAGRTADALSLLDKADARFEGSAAVTFRRGAVLSDAKRHAEAEKVFRGVLERDPKNADALNFLGYMFADLGQNLDEAVSLITRALAADEDNPSYMDSLGWAFFKKGDYTQAEKYLSRASDALPVNSVVQDHYGDVLARLGRQKEAVLAWEKALNGDGEEIDRAAIERKVRGGAPRGRK